MQLIEPYEIHVHTSFCDGKDTPEELVAEALKKGIRTLGFSGHSYTFFDESYCMSKEGTVRYKECIAKLKAQYAAENIAARINILCGTEQDYYSTEPTEDYDYVIGSVHYIRLGDEYVPVDENADILTEAARKAAAMKDIPPEDGIYALTDIYFETVADVASKIRPDIIGHFDLIAKCNGSGSAGDRGVLFDERDPRYVRAWKKAADTLITAGIPFEINKGAVTRGYRAVPYPAPDISDYLRSCGAEFIHSGDIHSKEDL